MNWQIPLIAKLSNNKSIHAEHIGILKNAKIFTAKLFSGTDKQRHNH